MIAVHDRRRDAHRRGRGRGRLRDALGVVPPPGCRRRSANRGRSARRSGLALRAHARAVSGRGRAPRGSASARRRCVAALERLGRERPRARGRVSRRDGRAASGATPRCCARSSAKASRGCGRRSSRSSPPRSRACSCDWQGVVAPARGRRRAARRGAAARGRAARRPRCSKPNPARAHPRLPRVATSTCCARRARWCGAGSSRSARPTAGSRSTCRIAQRSARAAAGPRRGRARRRACASCSSSAARCSSPTSALADRRLRRRPAAGAVGSGLGGRGDERHARAAALARCGVERASAASGVRRGAPSAAPARAAGKRGPLVAARAPGRGLARTDRAPSARRRSPARCSIATACSRARRCTPRASRAASPASTRCSRRWRSQGKVRRGYFVAGLGATQFALPGAEDRLRALRRAVGRGRAGGPRGDRSREPVRRRAAVARRFAPASVRRARARSAPRVHWS